MKYQWMPMFWGDFLAATMHLSAQEAGAYLFLIAHCWEHEGKIAVADLQRVARVNGYHWPRVRSRVAQFFDTSDVSNFWHHRRVHAELTKAGELSNKRKVAALQMHSKSRAHAQQMQNLEACKTAPSTTTKKSLLNGQASKPPIAKPNRPTVHSDFQEDGTEYRSPPRTKSDLPPMTDEQRHAAMILAAKGGRG
jgi:uncharacterized protein YdaU (DUF1376 family)